MQGLARSTLLLLCICTPGFADAPASSIRPAVRPAVEAAPVAVAAATAEQMIISGPDGSILRPRARPADATAALTPALVGASPQVVPRLVVSAPDGSILRPRARPAEVAAAREVPPAEITISSQAAAMALPQVLDAVLRPRPRPALALATPAPVKPDVPKRLVLKVTRVGIGMNVPRPEPRPSLVQIKPEEPIEKIEQVAAIRILPGKTAVFGRKGSVCGVPGIKGEKLAPITSKVRGCGIDEPVRVTSIDGVALSTAATINCNTAIALNDWVKSALKPAFKRKEVVGLAVAASYACRSRNNVKGAPISEHGRGNAIDISAILLADGSSVSVLDDWRNSSGKPMQAAYRAACGTFGTTLGPDADRFHRNHMHFDTASQRNGPYCR